MIERQFVSENIKEFQIKEFVRDNLSRVGLSDVKLHRTPLGEKIVVKAARPGLVVGRAGANITQLTRQLKEHFKLENPQIEIEEVENIHLDAAVVAENIAGFLERFGPQRFKSIGHRTMAEVMNTGAYGVEILISGKIPSSRAKRWRFYTGYLKKCGDVALHGVDWCYSQANLKTGVVGIQVSIMPKTTVLPDHIELLPEPETVLEELTPETEKEEPKEKKKAKESAKKKKAPKKTTKKSSKSKEDTPPKEETSPKEEVKEETAPEPSKDNVTEEPSKEEPASEPKKEEATPEPEKKEATPQPPKEEPKPATEPIPEEPEQKKEEQDK